MHEELDVLETISRRLEVLHLPFMLTGSLARRQPVEMSGVKTWIVSRKDLILSKLVWAKEANSELQRRDVKTLLYETMDRDYLERWAHRLGVVQILEEIAE